MFLQDDLLKLIQNFSGCFDTSGSMMPLSVPEISPCDGFCDVHVHGEELDILVVGYYTNILKCQTNI